MTTHLIKPGVPAAKLVMRCGLLGSEATDDDLLGTDDNFKQVDCLDCLRDLIADKVMAALGSDTPETRWLASGDTGTSSLTIWSVMTGRPMPDGRTPAPPLDPDDFGRCHRLLETFPAWRERLHEVAEQHADWSMLVHHWFEVTAMYQSEADFSWRPNTHMLMRDCLIGTRWGHP